MINKPEPPAYFKGLIKVQNNDQLDAEKARKDDAERAAASQGIQPVSDFISYVKAQIDDAKAFREDNGIDDSFITDLQQRNGKYDDETASYIAQIGMPDIYMRLTDVQCRAAESWLHDVLGFQLQRPLTFVPTPVPDIPLDAQKAIVDRTMKEVYAKFQEAGSIPPPEEVFNFAADMRDSIFEQIEDEAAVRANRMETVCYDQLVEGGWKTAWEDFISNLVTFKAGFLKGPIVRNKKVFAWTRNGRGYVPEVKIEPVIEFEAPNPQDMYPSRGATNCDDGDLFERVRFQRKHLVAMKDVEGYDNAAIDAVLERYGESGYSEMETNDSKRLDLEDQGTDTSAAPGVIQGWECWLSIQGKHLLQRGIAKDKSGKAIKPLAEYDANCILIGSYMIYCTLNADPLDKRPYRKESWAPKPGSFWGIGVPEIMSDLQRMCNADVRALVYNMGMGAGPQFVYPDVSRIPPGEPIHEIYPGKIHQFTNISQKSEQPFYAINIETKAAELQGIYEYFSQKSHEYTGIPAYEQGMPVAGAGRTLGGLSMLMSNSSRAIKYVIMRIDNNVLEPMMESLYDWNMQYNPDESIKGDVRIEAQGVLSRIIREQMAERRMQFLQATNNPVDMDLMGLESRAKVIREVAKTLDLTDDIVRPVSDVKQLEAKRRILLDKATQMQAEQLAGNAVPQ